MDSATRDLLTTHFVVFFCEGTAEEAVIGRLVEDERTIVPPDLIVKDPERFTSYTRRVTPKKFADKFLSADYSLDGSDGRLVVARIMDSNPGHFRLSKLQQRKIAVLDFITHPEIEMLVIHNEDAYNRWLTCRKNNHALKPCEFCKGELGLGQVKSADFLRDYWSDSDALIRSIRQYQSKRGSCPKGEFSLSDLLK